MRNQYLAHRGFCLDDIEIGPRDTLGVAKSTLPLRCPRSNNLLFQFTSHVEHWILQFVERFLFWCVIGQVIGRRRDDVFFVELVKKGE